MRRLDMAVVGFGRVARGAMGLAMLALGAASADAQPGNAPSAANDPMSCRALWQQVGLPTRAEDDPVATTPICHLGYVTAHNDAAKIPDWVLARITAADVAMTFSRPKVDFREETALPAGTRGAVNADYAGSGMDRGHQAASADFSGDEARMIDTFYYSNAVPQQGPGFNQHIWRELEERVQQLARDRGELVVITGPVLVSKGLALPAESDACGRAVVLGPPAKTALCDATDADPKAACTQGVAVPAALYKIIYDPQLRRVNAYLMPNVDHRPFRRDREASVYLQEFRVGVGTVEALTGLRFFTGLDRRSQRTLREQCTATMLH